MISKTIEQNKLVLGTLFGNNDLKCKGDDESISVLKFGLKIDDQYQSKSILMKSTLASHWSDEYHSFVLSWSPENIVFKIDGESHQLDTTNLPLDLIFDSEVYYLVIMSDYIIIILILNFHCIVLYIHWCVSWWYDKIPWRMFKQ